MKKKSNTFAGLEALPVDIMNKIVQQSRAPELIKQKEAPGDFGSWSELAASLEESGVLFGPLDTKVHIGNPYSGPETQRPQRTTVGEVLQQARLEEFQKFEGLGLDLDDLHLLRWLASISTSNGSSELVKKLERLMDMLWQKERTTTGRS